MDGSFMNDEAIFIEVTSSVDVSENSFLTHPSVYPNPSQGTIFSPFDVDQNGLVELSIYDQNGKLVFIQNEYFNSGANLAVLQTELDSGMYILLVKKDNKPITSQQFVVVK